MLQSYPMDISWICNAIQKLVGFIYDIRTIKIVSFLQRTEKVKDKDKDKGGKQTLQKAL